MMTPRITDHALLRWMERVHGLDIEALRAVMRDEVRASLDAAGSRRAHTKFGPAFVVASDGADVVTFIGAGQQVSSFRTGVAIARVVKREAPSERVEESVA